MATALSEKTRFAGYAVVTLDTVIKNTTIASQTSNLGKKVLNMDNEF
jgi:hypothetical protein